MKPNMTVVLGIGAPKGSMPPMPKRSTSASREDYGVRSPQDMAHELAETPSVEREEHSKVRISPEMVCYRDEDEACRSCEYRTADGHCEVIEMQVPEGASCNAWTQKTGEMQAIHDDGGTEAMGAE